MRISNKTRAFIAVCLAGIQPLHADELILKGGANQRLSGSVTSIDDQGVVELSSTLSATPLRLKPDALASVRFAEDDPAAKPTDSLAVLANGDRLPVEILSFSGDGGLEAQSPGLGALRLPASKLASLEFGVGNRKELYSGPGDPGDWSPLQNKTARKSITVEDGRWLVAGSADLARKIPMSRDFIVRFRLHWETGSQPNFRLFFANPGGGRETKADRYFLQFGSAGLEVKRESTQGQRYPSVLISNRMPGSFVGREVEVELQVSRSTRRITLFLNGEMEAWGTDPAEGLPSGDGVMLSFAGSQNTRQTLSSLSVQELDNMRMRHRAEDRGDPKQDGLISRDDDRWTGSVREIRKEQDELLVVFEAPHRKEPLEIPISKVSTVFFRSPAGLPAAEPAAFRLQLRGEGSLTVQSCRIHNDIIAIRHPLLGTLEIPKNTVLGIENIRAADATAPDREQE